MPIFLLKMRSGGTDAALETEHQPRCTLLFGAEKWDPKRLRKFCSM